MVEKPRSWEKLFGGSQNESHLDAVKSIYSFLASAGMPAFRKMFSALLWFEAQMKSSAEDSLSKTHARREAQKQWEANPCGASTGIDFPNTRANHRRNGSRKLPRAKGG